MNTRIVLRKLYTILKLDKLKYRRQWQLSNLMDTLKVEFYDSVNTSIIIFEYCHVNMTTKPYDFVPFYSIFIDASNMIL